MQDFIRENIKDNTVFSHLVDDRISTVAPLLHVRQLVVCPIGIALVRVKTAVIPSQ